jgi:Fe-S-cluster-containing hydrogenase component 2
VFYSPAINSLNWGTWFKLICGASFQHLPAIRSLTVAYTLAGADCIDVAADPAVIFAAREGMSAAVDLAQIDRPWLMVSLNDAEDPHFRKADFDPDRCPADCSRPCERICPPQAISIAGVKAAKCYGCGRCVPVCPIGQIITHDRIATPTSIIPALIAGEIDAIEIHTHVGHFGDFQRLWAILAPVAYHLKLLAISCPDDGELIPYLTALYHTIADTYHPESLPFTLLWQTDGRPMSGDIGAGTTHAAIKLGEKVLKANLPGYVQLAGGTNHYTVPKLRELGLLPPTTAPKHIHGVAYGSYARVLLSPILDRLDTQTTNPGQLEAHPDLLNQAVEKATELVSQLKLVERK